MGMCEGGGVFAYVRERGGGGGVSGPTL